MRPGGTTMRGRQSTGRVMAGICTDTVTAPGVSVNLITVALCSSEVWALHSVQPASASGNTGLMVPGTLVTSESSAVFSVNT